jgi:septal ring factor EnvC (AmiA/AmiB activator)
VPRREALRAALAALLIAAAFGTPAPAADPPPERRLKELESALEKGRAETEKLKRQAAELSKELGDLNKDMVQAARGAQEHEEHLSELEGRLTQLREAERLDSEALERRKRQMLGVLTAVERLAWRPTEALIAQPTSPADTVRSAILLRAALPQIRDSAEVLRKELADLSSLRADIARKRHDAAQTQTKLDAEQRRLKGMVKRKQLLQQMALAEGQDAEKRLSRMAVEAEDLRDLMARLEEDRKRREAEAKRRRDDEIAAAKLANQPPPPAKPPLQVAAARPFSQRMGDLPFPARGNIAAGFGQATDVGTTHKGITIETRPGAQEIAPYDGQVVFSGAFRGYGQLLIIEHGEGYHTLLAGMARIDSLVGQRLTAGEPVGVMENTEGKPALYFELRRNGQPVNPLPWLTARKDKVSG